MEKLKEKSRLLSLVLRHHPDKLDLHMDKFGWVNVSDLVEKSGITIDELKSIVEQNDKKRFAFSDDGTRIRASQGHSVDVDLGLKAYIPPFVLYHGTGMKSAQTILKEGIKRMRRNYVHLSEDEKTAIAVGSRHGTPVVITIQASRMYADGIKFFYSANGVWLTDYVDPKYFVK